jgi:D-arabinitol dehydrogenase (NADP+)
VGSGVSQFRKGDHVVADNALLCGDCYHCRRDEPLYCENFYSLGVNGPGGFAEYVLVNQEKVFAIPDDMNFDTASFAEPTACAIHGMDRINVKCGDQVLLFGAGPTGIILAQLLQQGGASDLLLAAPTRFKLDAAEAMGIRETLCIDRNDYDANKKAIRGRYPRGFDIVIDATGSVNMLEHCLEYTKKGSKLVFYGVYDEQASFPLNPYTVFSQELTLIGSCAQTHCFPRALQYLTKGIVQVDKLITHRFALDDYGTALNTVMNGRQSMKVLIKP